MSGAGVRCVYCALRFPPRGEKGKRLICGECWKLIRAIATPGKRDAIR